MRTFILTLILIASAGLAQAQTVTGVQNITFGSLFRSQTVTVLPSGAGAARFRVTGITLFRVRLTVTTTSLSRNSNTLPVTVNNSDCEFSLDGGNTWTDFTTGTLIQDTRFPWSPSLVGTIDVRVGGAVTSSSRQQRGVYTGSVSLNAVYK